jgi:hypothetical protein
MQIELTSRQFSLLIELMERACWRLKDEIYEARTLREHLDLEARSDLVHQLLGAIWCTAVPGSDFRWEALKPRNVVGSVSDRAD